jgi:basic membrane protein A
MPARLLPGVGMTDILFSCTDIPPEGRFMNRRYLSVLLGALTLSMGLAADQSVAARPAPCSQTGIATSSHFGMVPISGNANARGCRVCLLTDPTGIEDRCFNASAWRGILSFYGDTWENPRQKGKSYDFVMSRSWSDMDASLMLASEKRYDLIIAAGFMWSDPMSEAALRHPTQKYLILDVDYVDRPNVMQITFAEHEGSYLVGVAAALKARAQGLEKPKFGFVGGIPTPVVTGFEMGYIQGLRSVYPRAEILEYYANDWGKPELAMAKAREWYDEGVYAIFSAAGGTGNGVIAQAKESRRQGMDVWALGVDTDQYEDGIYEQGRSAVLTSVIKRLDNAVKYALRRLAEGSFKGESLTLGAKGDGIDFATTNPELGADIAAQVAAVKARIARGEIHVYRTYAETKAAGLAPAGLEASDR